MEALADDIRQAILTILWDDAPIGEPPTLEPQPATRSAGSGRVRQRDPAGQSRAQPLRRHARRHPQRPDRLHDRELGEPQLGDRSTGRASSTSGPARSVTCSSRRAPAWAATPSASRSPTNGGGAEQQVNRAGSLPTGWQHVAVTRSGTTNTLYINGVAVAHEHERDALAGRASGNTTNNWIGRSQYPDPLLAGLVDEFQIYDRAARRADEVHRSLDSPGGHDRRRQRRLVPLRRGRRRHRPRLVRQRAARDGRDRTPVRRRLAGQGVQAPADARTASWSSGRTSRTSCRSSRVSSPTTPEYTQALRYYADAAEYPIMPFYTSNQRDKAFATALGIPGSNNFSNINSTLQAQRLRPGAARLPDRSTSRQEMYRKLLEWSTLGAVRRRRQPSAEQQRVLLQLEPDDQDIRAVRDLPQHPGRLQLHAHRRHRRRPAAPRRPARALADRRRLGATSRSTTCATTATT